MPASAERVEDKTVTRSYTTALTSKPRIPTSKEVLARRTPEEEEALMKGNLEAMQGPRAEMYFGPRSEIPNDFQLPSRDDIERLEAEQVKRLRAKLGARQAEERKKSLQQGITISAFLDTPQSASQKDQ